MSVGVCQASKLAARNLARNPVLSLICALVLAVGIAASTASFMVVDTAVRRPLPFPNPDRLALIRERNLATGLSDRASYPAFTSWRDRGQAFQEIGAAEVREFNLGAGTDSVSITGALATPGFFRALGWTTVLGRSFAAADNQPGSDRIILISQRCWESRFGSDPGIIGRELVIDGEKATVIGVLARIIGRSYYASYEIWAPLVETAARANREARTLEVVGLLKPGAAFAQVEAELDVIGRAASAAGPDTWTARVIPMAQMMAHTAPLFVALLAIVILLLVIVCSNIAALQLARSYGRQREVAIRIALGADRWSIVRYLLGEATLLAALSGLLGFALTAVTRQVLVASVPELAELRMDLGVFGFTALISLGAAMLFGLWPALQASRPDVNAELQSAERGMSRKAGGRTRAVLVISQMAMAVALLTGLGMLVRAFIAMRHTDMGFRTENVVAVSVTLPKERAGGQSSAAFFRTAGERLRGLAGMQSVAAVSVMPLAGGGGILAVESEPNPKIANLQGQYTIATPDYFQTLSIALRRGRPFGAADTATSPGVVIVNERAARALWPGLDPIGRRVRLNHREWRTVIAIASDVRQDLFRPAMPEFYVPHAQDSVAAMWVIVRTSIDARRLVAGVRAELRSMERGLRISAPVTMEDAISGYLPGTLVAGMAVFCAAALFLALLGLYGVVSYLATQRTHEFGVRIALGARSRDVQRLVLAQGVKLAGAGAAIGLGGGFMLARLLPLLRFGGEVSGAGMLVAIAALLSAVVLAACWLPARSAMRISPIEALRRL